ncbi:hypothetical protein N0V90_006665 [Kalmusia sp. IMI 367209]|nr:hypothetical protein N0V90_006665 [Kalmusia sp. IMI 367209]
MVFLCGRKIRQLIRERIKSADSRKRLVNLANWGLGKLWWHILTGIGAYVGMALVEYLVTVEEGETDRIEEGFVWPVNTVLRDLEGEGKSKGKKAM